MASYGIELRRAAERDLRGVGPALIPRILGGDENLAEDPLPRQSVKLHGTERLYRIRVGQHRVLYEVDPTPSMVVVYYIRHRRDAYRSL